MEILYQDARIVVALKPPGVVSTDEPGGMPQLLRQQLNTSCIRTVHRLDQAAGGVMVFARSHRAAAILSQQIQARTVEKEYLAVCCGAPRKPSGTFCDLLRRDRATHRTEVASEPSKDTRPASLDYVVLGTAEGLSLVRIRLHTGRTHQIRVQFASRGLPLAGDRRYGDPDASFPLALWSCRLRLNHPQSGEMMEFSAPPPQTYPWNCFQERM